MKTLNDNRKRRWLETVVGLDFTRSSYKAWGLMKKLGEKELNPHPVCSTPFSVQEIDIALKKPRHEKQPVLIVCIPEIPEIHRSVHLKMAGGILQ